MSAFVFNCTMRGAEFGERAAALGCWMRNEGTRYETPINRLQQPSCYQRRLAQQPHENINLAPV
jgi:hypothetical protein